MSKMEQALDQFDRTEVNVDRLAGLWERYAVGAPDSCVFGRDTPEVDQLRREWKSFASALPMIDGFRPTDQLPAYDEIAQFHFDAMEVGEIEVKLAAHDFGSAPGRDLAEYRHRLRQTRLRLVRSALDDVVAEIDRHLASAVEQEGVWRFSVDTGWDHLRGTGRTALSPAWL